MDEQGERGEAGGTQDDTVDAEQSYGHNSKSKDSFLQLANNSESASSQGPGQGKNTTGSTRMLPNKIAQMQSFKQARLPNPWCCSDNANHAFLWTILMFLFLVVYMLVFGALIQAVEVSKEAEENQRVTALFAAIRPNITEEAFAQLVALTDYDEIRGKEDFTSYVGGDESDAGDNDPEQTGKWEADGISLGSAYYFSYTLVSTIGYGDVAPITPAGRGLAILCVLFGVPIAVMVYSRLADTIFKGTLSCMLRRTNKFQLVLKQYDLDHNGTLGPEELEMAFKDLGMKVDSETVRTLINTFDVARDGGLSAYELSEACHALGLDLDDVAKSRFKIRFAAFLVIVYTLATAAYLASVLSISYLDSIYYSVMTFTTAGLGDITVTRELRPAITVISMTALAFFAMLVDGLASYDKSGYVEKLLKKNLLRRESLTLSQKLYNIQSEHHGPGTDSPAPAQ